MTEPQLSSNNDPFGAFFDYAAGNWRYHLGRAPVNFNLDDVLALASPASARHRAWAPLRPYQINHLASSASAVTHLFILQFGNMSMFNQLLDRLAPNGDGFRRSIVKLASNAISWRKPGHFQALMNHQNTAMDMRTVKLLKESVIYWDDFHSDNRKEWTQLITDLFDRLASDTIPASNYLLMDACEVGCMPAVEKIFERANADPAFREQLMQPTESTSYQLGPLCKVVERGDVKMLRYLCQQDGIEAHASNRHGEQNILAYSWNNPRVEIVEPLLDRFPWLASERGGIDVALPKIIQLSDKLSERTSQIVKAAKFLLQRAQATPGLIDVDKLLAQAARRCWPDMCCMLIVDGGANAQTVVKMPSSGRLELKERWLAPGQVVDLSEQERYERTLQAIAARLSEEMWQAIAAAHLGNE